MEYGVEMSQYFTDKNYSFFISMKEKLKTCRSSKLNFSSSCFIADVKIVWLHVVVFSEHDTLAFLR